MSEVKARFIKTIESLPYDIDEEVLKKDFNEIIYDVTKKYVDTYGVDDLSEGDKECIRNIIGNVI
ncbi:MAG: hypothetical protein IJ809_07045 [Clostridia bacterium]|nr:hypothetical protein [Clostridia bacterium]